MPWAQHRLAMTDLAICWLEDNDVSSTLELKQRVLLVDGTLTADNRYGFRNFYKRAYHIAPYVYRKIPNDETYQLQKVWQIVFNGFSSFFFREAWQMKLVEHRKAENVRLGEVTSNEDRDWEKNYLNQTVNTNHLVLLMQWLEDLATAHGWTQPVWRRFEIGNQSAVYSTTPIQNDLQERPWHIVYYFRDIMLWIMNNIPGWEIHWQHFTQYDNDDRRYLTGSTYGAFPIIAVPNVPASLQLPSEGIQDTGYSIEYKEENQKYAHWPKENYFSLFPMNMAPCFGPPGIVISKKQTWYYPDDDPITADIPHWETNILYLQLVMSAHAAATTHRLRVSVGDYYTFTNGVPTVTASDIQTAINACCLAAGIPTTVTATNITVPGFKFFKLEFSDSLLTTYSGPTLKFSAQSMSVPATFVIAGGNTFNSFLPGIPPTTIVSQLILQPGDTTNPDKIIRVEHYPSGTNPGVSSVVDLPLYGASLPTDLINAMTAGGSAPILISDTTHPTTRIRTITVHTTYSGQDAYWLLIVGFTTQYRPRILLGDFSSTSSELTGSYGIGADLEHKPLQRTYQELTQTTPTTSYGHSTNLTRKVYQLYHENIEAQGHVSSTPTATNPGRWHKRKLGGFTATKEDFLFCVPLFGGSLKNYYGLYKGDSQCKLKISVAAIDEFTQNYLGYPPADKIAYIHNDLPTDIQVHFGILTTNFSNLASDETCYNEARPAASTLIGTISLTDTNPTITQAYGSPIPIGFGQFQNNVINTVTYPNPVEIEFDLSDLFFTGIGEYIVIAFTIDSLPDASQILPGDTDIVYDLPTFYSSTYRQGIGGQWQAGHRHGSDYFNRHYTSNVYDETKQNNSPYHPNNYLPLIYTGPISNPLYDPPNNPNDDGQTVTEPTMVAPEHSTFIDIKVDERGYNAFGLNFSSNDFLARDYRHNKTFHSKFKDVVSVSDKIEVDA